MSNKYRIGLALLWVLCAYRLDGADLTAYLLVTLVLGFLAWWATEALDT